MIIQDGTQTGNLISLRPKNFQQCRLPNMKEEALNECNQVPEITSLNDVFLYH